LSGGNNFEKTFCLVLRQHGLEDHLNDSLKKTVYKAIGDVDVETDRDCYIVLGYNKTYNLDASNGSCVKFTRDIEKIRDILKNFI
jgi:hypothetical protein